MRRGDPAIPLSRRGQPRAWAPAPCRPSSIGSVTAGPNPTADQNHERHDEDPHDVDHDERRAADVQREHGHECRDRKSESQERELAKPRAVGWAEPFHTGQPAWCWAADDDLMRPSARGIRRSATPSSASVTCATSAGSAVPSADASGPSIGSEARTARRSRISSASRTTVRRPSRASIEVSSAPRSRSRATDADTWL